jgi:hypothetical protein
MEKSKRKLKRESTVQRDFTRLLEISLVISEKAELVVTLNLCLQFPFFYSGCMVIARRPYVI